jgi:hypothetical protein
VYDSEGNEASLVLEKANLFHNHYLLTPSKTKHQHKSIDSAIFDIIDELQDAGVSSQQIKNVLQCMGGMQNLFQLLPRTLPTGKIISHSYLC